jgi:4-hydroxybenzoate polyprenyltransferase
MVISSTKLVKAFTAMSQPIRTIRKATVVTDILWSMPTFSGDIIHNLYFITIDDSATFVVPNTIFGLVAAAKGCFLSTPDHNLFVPKDVSWTTYTFVLLRTVSFNWANLLLFDLANQRVAGDEDKLNKPWRPIPNGRMTTTRMRHWLIITIPLVLGYNHFCLGTLTEGCLLCILTWIYNDLSGGDDNWIIRNMVIASAFGVYNLGSAKVAATATVMHTNGTPSGSEVAVGVSNLGYAWAVLISAVIFTTMHVQDLKDVIGDRARGRCTAPIVLGRQIASYTIAVPVLVWSSVCPWFWAVPLWSTIGTCLLGLIIAWRCMSKESKLADRRTWQMWCAWTAVLYLLPLCV